MQNKTQDDSASPALLEPSLIQPLDKFLHYLQNERGYSSHTTGNYQRSLIELGTFLQDRSVVCWSAATDNELKAWLIELRHKQLKPRTIQLKLSAVKGLFKYLLLKGKLQRDPTELLHAPKADKPLPKNMEVDEVAQLLNFEPCETIEYRDKAMMELFYSSGLRLSELADVKLDDFDSSYSELRVLGKGSKERVVPVGTKAKAALEAWINCRHEYNLLDSKSVFLSQRGNAISVRQIQQRLKHWATRQGINNQVHPHKLRHSFASHVLESSGNLRAVQELLGHSNLSTTQVYTHLDFQHLANIYDKAHPRAKKS